MSDFTGSPDVAAAADFESLTTEAGPSEVEDLRYLVANLVLILGVLGVTEGNSEIVDMTRNGAPVGQQEGPSPMHDCNVRLKRLFGLKGDVFSDDLAADLLELAISNIGRPRPKRGYRTPPRR